MDYRYKILANGVVLLTLEGRLDACVAPLVSTILEEHTAAKRFHIVIVMNDVTYISAAVLRCFIATWKECRQFNRGRFVLAETNENIIKVLVLTGLSEQFDHCESVAEAVALASVRNYHQKVDIG